MSNSHLSALETKHAALARKVEVEEQRPHPDAALLAGLKKQKLKLKEELSGL